MKSLPSPTRQQGTSKEDPRRIKNVLAKTRHVSKKARKKARKKGTQKGTQKRHAKEAREIGTQKRHAEKRRTNKVKRLHMQGHLAYYQGLLVKPDSNRFQTD